MLQQLLPRRRRVRATADFTQKRVEAFAGDCRLLSVPETRLRGSRRETREVTPSPLEMLRKPRVRTPVQERS